MSKKKPHQITKPKPVENHQTAPWTNIEKTQPVSQVPSPNDWNAEFAKEWVEINQK